MLHSGFYGGKVSGKISKERNDWGERGKSLGPLVIRYRVIRSKDESAIYFRCSDC